MPLMRMPLMRMIVMRIVVMRMPLMRIVVMLLMPLMRMPLMRMPLMRMPLMRMMVMQAQRQDLETGYMKKAKHKGKQVRVDCDLVLYQHRPFAIIHDSFVRSDVWGNALIVEDALDADAVDYEGTMAMSRSEVGAEVAAADDDYQ
jgi:hypothetical protein